MWLFHLHSAVKIQPFSPVFPLAGSTAKAFFRLSLWNFKEKTSTIFYNTAKFQAQVRYSVLEPRRQRSRGLCAPCRKALSLEMVGYSHWPFYPEQWGFPKRSSCINPVPALRIFHKEFFRMMS